MGIPMPKCEICNTEMVLREKDNSKFWGCPLYRKCGGKTKPYDGVDKPKAEDETLARIEMKLDYLIDVLKTPEQRQAETSGTKEIKASEIPF